MISYMEKGKRLLDEKAGGTLDRQTGQRRMEWI